MVISSNFINKFELKYLQLKSLHGRKYVAERPYNRVRGHQENDPEHR